MFGRKVNQGSTSKDKGDPHYLATRITTYEFDMS